jgi:hypothetical protein
MEPENNINITPSLSKRGARRVIQRAFVLMGRNKALRQKLRSVSLTTRWVVEDWGLEWSVILEKGHVEFHRGHVGKPQVNVVWSTGDQFLAHLESGISPAEGFEFDCEPDARRTMEVILQTFPVTLRNVLADPIDDDGVRLV